VVRYCDSSTEISVSEGLNKKKRVKPTCVLEGEWKRRQNTEAKFLWSAECAGSLWYDGLRASSCNSSAQGPHSVPGFPPAPVQAGAEIFPFPLTFSKTLTLTHSSAAFPSRRESLRWG